MLPINADNYTDYFVNDLYSVKDSISPETLHQAKLCILDYLGTAYAGAKLLGEKGSLLKDALGGGTGDAVLLGYKQTGSALQASFMNAFVSHYTELDDGERFGMVHPGTTIISALLSLVKQEHLSSDDLLLGIISGYEATIKIARFLQPALKKKGFHATGVCGSIGVAMGASIAMGLTKAQLKAALSAASTSAAGLLETITGESEQKAFNAGHASMSGLVAAMVGKSGIYGPEDILGGERGLIHSLIGNHSREWIPGSPGDRLLIMDVYRKPYAACRHCHPAIEAVLQIVQDSEMQAEEIDHIDVITYDLAVYGHDHKDIGSIGSAKMSIPYSVAVAILSGKAGLDEFDETRIMLPSIHSLMSRIDVHSDPVLSAQVPEKRSAIVRLKLTDKSIREAKIELPKGEPERPMTEEEIIAKFSELSYYAGRSERDTSTISKCVMNLESDLNELLAVL